MRHALASHGMINKNSKKTIAISEKLLYNKLN